MSTPHKKLVIHIPCYNEEGCIAHTLRQMPRSVAGFDSVDILITDDGSTDRTVEIARAEGIMHILVLPRHVGLAGAFRAGLAEAHRIGADVMVNLDADNQYNAQDIESVVRPVLEGRSQIVVGERDLQNLPYFSPFKRKLHLIGNWVIRRISGLPVSDATSSFRAIHKDLIPHIRIHSTYTYTIEMLLFLAFHGIPVLFVPIRCHDKVLRPSRLIRSNSQYLYRTSIIILRCLAMYRPFVFFGALAALMAAMSFLCDASVWKILTLGGSILSVIAGLALARAIRPNHALPSPRLAQHETSP